MASSDRGPFRGVQSGWPAAVRAAVGRTDAPDGDDGAAVVPCPHAHPVKEPIRLGRLAAFLRRLPPRAWQVLASPLVRACRSLFLADLPADEAARGRAAGLPAGPAARPRPFPAPRSAQELTHRWRQPFLEPHLGSSPALLPAQLLTPFHALLPEQLLMPFHALLLGRLAAAFLAQRLRSPAPPLAPFQRHRPPALDRPLPLRRRPLVRAAADRLATGRPRHLPARSCRQPPRRPVPVAQLSPRPRRERPKAPVADPMFSAAAPSDNPESARSTRSPRLTLRSATS